VRTSISTLTLTATSRVVKTLILTAVVFIVFEAGKDEEGRGGLLVFGRCRGCGGRSSSSIRFKGMAKGTTTVMGSRLTTACMALV
jgi:hypothetical protein